MKPPILATLIAVALISCSKTQPLANSGQAPLAAPTTACTDTECETIMKNQTVNATRGQLACCYLLLGSIAGCQWHANPPPAPSGTGGALSTGGRASTGGNAATGGASTAPATSTSPEAQACANVAKFCAPKTVGSCLSDVAKIQSVGKYASIDLNCLIKATSQASTQACKSVVCGSTSK